MEPLDLFRLSEYNYSGKIVGADIIRPRATNSRPYTDSLDLNLYYSFVYLIPLGQIRENTIFVGWELAPSLQYNCLFYIIGKCSFLLYKKYFVQKPKRLRTQNLYDSLSFL